MATVLPSLASRAPHQAKTPEHGRLASRGRSSAGAMFHSGLEQVPSTRCGLSVAGPSVQTILARRNPRATG